MLSAIPQKLGHFLMVPVRMVPWIWQAMFGNGLMIGLPLTITKIHRNRTHLVHPPDQFTCCGVVHGISTTTSFVLPTAAGILRSPIWVSASDVPWMRISKG